MLLYAQRQFPENQSLTSKREIERRCPPLPLSGLAVGQKSDGQLLCECDNDNKFSVCQGLKCRRIVWIVLAAFELSKTAIKPQLWFSFPLACLAS